MQYGEKNQLLHAGRNFQKFFETDAHRLAEGVRKVGRVEQK